MFLVEVFGWHDGKDYQKSVMHTRTMLFGHILATHVHPNASILLPARFHMESMNGKALEKYLCSKPHERWIFSYENSCRLMWYQDKTQGLSQHSWKDTHFFLGGEIKLDANVVLVILEGLPWKIVPWSLWGFTPKLGEDGPKLTTAQYFFQMGGKKTPSN